MATAEDVYMARLGLGNELVDVAGAKMIRNPDLPHVRDANLLYAITARTESEVDDLLIKAEEYFAGIPHRRFDLGMTQNEVLEERLNSLGYTLWADLLMVLEGKPRGEPRDEEKPVEIHRVVKDKTWADFKILHELYYREELDTIPEIDFEVSTSDQILQSHHLKTPPVRHYVAYERHQPAGLFTGWVGLDGLGQIEHLFVDPGHRLKGIATALILWAIDECSQQGATRVLVSADPDDTPRDIYEAMGFRSVGIMKSYWKELGSK